MERMLSQNILRKEVPDTLAPLSLTVAKLTSAADIKKRDCVGNGCCESWFVTKKMRERVFRSPFFSNKAKSCSQNGTDNNTKQRNYILLCVGFILRADRAHILASPSFTVNVSNVFSPACIK